MPSIHYLNPPPNPFWDFVANLEDHPFFSAYGRNPQTSGFRQNANTNQQEAPEQEQHAQTSETAQEKQPSAEDETQDPPEVIPEELRGMPFRGRGRFGRAFEDGPGPHRGGPGCRGRGGRHGPPGGFGPHEGPHHYGPPRGGPWWARGPPHGEHHGPPHGPPHHHHGPGARSPGRREGRHGRRGPGGFDLPEFLNNLGNRLGVDLSGAAEGLGLERFSAPKANNEADFEPRADLFDTTTNYTIHVSLPGARKEDLGVEWDGENSILRIAGVVHRPGADEEMLKQLAVDGRKREVGVFEKSIRLGTRRDPASIDIAAISAKMTDGILVVKVPKVEVEHRKREVPITSSATPSPPQAAARDVNLEKGTLLDAEEEHDDTPVLKATPLSADAKEKEAEYQRERSETMDFEHEEHLPAYEGEEAQDHEFEDEDEEGEYVKINVD